MTEGSIAHSRQVLKIDGGRIREIREQKGLTQLYVASVVGVTTDTISRWENRKYPSIRRENALKLAEALEVPLDEILEQGDLGQRTGERAGANNVISHTRGKKRPNFSTWQWAVIAIVALIVGLLFLFAKKTDHGAPSAIVTATRILPTYVAPGARFPVLIKIAESGSKTSVLIKESIPRACALVGYYPGTPALSKGRSTLQWILPVPKGGLDFVYVLQCNPKMELGKKLRFSGTITSKGIKYSNLPLEGEQITRTGPFHWADRNADGVIDDQEVLEAFDTLGQVKELEQDLTELETLWAKGAYKWDPIKKGFYSIKEAENNG